ncbi:amidohydrolase/deacetylase family metallohydrolase [Kaistia algarum]|uniref:amidohydrolase/deacetylase family metallohydrolase n=1 Tax=Kaistia algarum TaxID=2083279 RepID=UPI000CE8DF5C|nr:amidohydrolase/deacetylase family metallohydrolase [Kaistia algarum]MCX5514900.1 amidohydrolase/deacetylase family metallohydrolase [Kaistia algarum]PPE79652.1 amidohydrolase/deacetylase family metallohydrolase [Kaistia algarum]
MTYDLVLTNGRVLDPSQGLDRVVDIAFSGRHVAAIGENLAPSAKSVRDVSGKIVTPGLIDLHTHVYWGGTSLGVDPEDYARQTAVTTCVDTGSAGPGNFPGFRKHVIEPCGIRILVYLHVSFAGIYAFSPRIMIGEGHDQRLLAARDAAEVADANRDVIIGIKVRIGRNASGPAGIAPLDVALDVGEATGLPVMVHIDEPPPSYGEVIDRLRPGDVLTHAFRGFPNAPVLADGTIRPQVIAARERGVLFDIGHGMGSFSWKSARAMLAKGFAPDTISSDVHAMSIHGPAFDQVTTLSKFLALGMPLGDVIAASTVKAAEALQRPELGTLKVGAVGDASVLSLRDGAFPLEDSQGEVVTAPQRIVAEGMVVGGAWWHSAQD